MFKQQSNLSTYVRWGVWMLSWGVGGGGGRVEHSATSIISMKSFPNLALWIRSSIDLQLGLRDLTILLMTSSACRYTLLFGFS